MRTSAGPGRTPFEYAGRTWWTDDGAVAGYDATMRGGRQARGGRVGDHPDFAAGAAAAAGSYARTVGHPDADPSGIFAMPNLTTRDGCEAYAARLGVPGPAVLAGRTASSAGSTTTSCTTRSTPAGSGRTPARSRPATYLDLYHRSMRAAHLLARQYDPHAKAFISLTHHWAKPGEHAVATAAESCSTCCWLLAGRGRLRLGDRAPPVPAEPADPRVWADTQATFSFDTPKVTFRNLEVLDAWARQPGAMFRGKRVRTIHLTEQGLNSQGLLGGGAARPGGRDRVRVGEGAGPADRSRRSSTTTGSTTAARAACGSGSGGSPTTRTEPLGPKPIWDVYKALGTPREAEVTGTYLEVVGAKSWDEVRYRGVDRE